MDIQMSCASYLRVAQLSTPATTTAGPHWRWHQAWDIQISCASYLRMAHLPVWAIPTPMAVLHRYRDSKTAIRVSCVYCFRTVRHDIHIDAYAAVSCRRFRLNSRGTELLYTPPSCILQWPSHGC